MRNYGVFTLHFIYDHATIGQFHAKVILTIKVPHIKISQAFIDNPGSLERSYKKGKFTKKPILFYFYLFYVEFKTVVI